MTLCYSAQPGLATQNGLTTRVGTKGNGGKGSTRSRTSVCVYVCAQNRGSSHPWRSISLAWRGGMGILKGARPRCAGVCVCVHAYAPAGGHDGQCL